MKTSIAALLAVLALLLADLAGAQTPVTRQAPTHQTQVKPTASVTQGGAGRLGAMRGAMAAHFPVAHRPPAFVRHPFFRHPGYFGPGYFGSGFFAGSPAYAPAQGYAYGYDYPGDYPGYVQNAAYAPPQAQYWAYCRNPQGYYPYVSECSEGWLPVTPTSSPPPLIPAQTPDAGLQLKAASGGGDSIEEIRARIAHSRAD
jgi:hypothetical protein